MALFVEVGALRVGNLAPFVQNSAVIDSTFVSEQTQNPHVPIVLNKIPHIEITISGQTHSCCIPKESS